MKWCSRLSLRSRGSLVVVFELGGAIFAILSCIFFLLSFTESGYIKKQEFEAAGRLISILLSHSQPTEPPLDWASQVTKRNSTTPTPPGQIKQYINNEETSLQGIRVTRMIWGFSMFLYVTQIGAALSLARGISKSISSYLIFWIYYKVVVLVISFVINIILIMMWGVNATTIIQIIVLTILNLICIKIIFDLHLEMKLKWQPKIEDDTDKL